MERKLISFDWALKKILRSKANFKVLEGFLSELLEKDITILEILESESNKEHAKDKYNRVDLLVKDSQDEFIIIELQHERQLDYLHRMLYGTSKVIVENIEEGDPYLKVKKVISINIVYFDPGQGPDYIYEGNTNFTGRHLKDMMQLSNEQKSMFKKTMIRDIHPEYYLLKLNNFNDVAKDSLDEWIYFFKNSAVKDCFKAKGLKEAKRVLDIAKLSDEGRREYSKFVESLHDQASYYESTYGDGLRKGEAKGIEQGKRDQAFEIARSMIAEGIPIETIARCTGLTIEEVEKLPITKHKT